MPKLQSVAIHLAAIALSLVTAASAKAEVFKCPSADGKVEYRDSPCAPGISGKKMQVAPAPTTMEVLTARQVANKNSIDLKAATAPPPGDGIPTFMGKILNTMKMNDIQRQEKLRQGDKAK